MTPRENGSGMMVRSHPLARIQGLAAKPQKITGAPVNRARVGAPGCITSAGPRGPSGVMATPPPDLTHRIMSRKACSPCLFLSVAVAFFDEPRIDGKPIFWMVRAMISPSADLETSTRMSCRPGPCGQQ